MFRVVVFVDLDFLLFSIENFEKIRVLRESGASTPALEKALAEIDYTKAAANGSEGYFIGKVKAVTDAIGQASEK